MDADAIIGVAVVVIALLVIVGLVLWGRWSINHIARNGFGSAREIKRARLGR